MTQQHFFNGSRDMKPAARQNERSNKDEFGNVLNTQVHRINHALIVNAVQLPHTARELAEYAGAEQGPVFSHLQTLKDRGFVKHRKEGYILTRKARRQVGLN
jgi:hypothetical protein